MTIFNQNPVNSQGFGVYAQLEWDGSFIQKRYHSGRTDPNLGHHDRISASGLGKYHFHHGSAPHLPCCRSQIHNEESLIDLFKQYGGSAWTTTTVVSNIVTHSFHAGIEVIPFSKIFALDIRIGGIENSEFFITQDFERTPIEPFWGTSLSPRFVTRSNSLWTGVDGAGFDFWVNAEHFHHLVEQNTGLRPMTIFTNSTGAIIDERALDSIEMYYRQNFSLRQHIAEEGICIFAF